MIVWTHNTLAVKLWQFMDRGKGTLTALSWWWNSCHRWGTLLAEFDGFKSPRTREVVATRMGMLWRNTLGTCHIYIFPYVSIRGIFWYFSTWHVASQAWKCSKRLLAELDSPPCWRQGCTMAWIGDKLHDLAGRSLRCFRLPIRHSFEHPDVDFLTFFWHRNSDQGSCDDQC